MNDMTGDAGSPSIQRNDSNKLSKGRQDADKATPQVQGDTNETALQKEKYLQTELKYMYMNHCEKYTTRKQIPWNLTAQIFSIILITTQVSDKEIIWQCLHL